MKKVRNPIFPRLAIFPLSVLLLASPDSTRASDAVATTLDGIPGTPAMPSAKPMGRLGISAGLSGYGHSDEGLLKDSRFLFDTAGNTGEPDSLNIQDLQSGTLRFNLAIGLTRNIDLALSVPLHLDLTSDTKAEILTGSGMGDPSLSVKAGFSLAGDHVLDAAVLGSLSIASDAEAGFLPKHTGYVGGDGAAAEPRYFSTGSIGYSALALLSLDPTHTEARIPFRAHLSGGVKFPGLGGGRMLLGGGLEWVPLPFLAFFAAAQSETRFSAMDQGVDKEWLTASGGFTANSDDGVFFSVSAQKRLSEQAFRAYSKKGGGGTFHYQASTLADLSLAISLGWSGMFGTQDRDKDDVPDKEDLCPEEPEDTDGFQDMDGCPDSDNDEDSVSDLMDKCPLQPEDRDGYEDKDGCADRDNDADGIPDALDKCPGEVEDKDGFEDYDGCPDLDDDKDGVLDQHDKCRQLAEDLDNFEDADGCPEPDNDKDHILDANDKCPLEAETLNSIDDLDGCPDQAGRKVLPLERRRLLRSVRFLESSNEMAAAAYPSLDSLAARIKATPEAYVEIRAYTDNSGTEESQRKLTEGWAQTVRKYLLLKGVLPGQVTARPMGAESPIATNETAAGRARNRRIEMYRLD